MKKSLQIIALLLLAGVGAKAQKEVLFKMQVAPNRHYNMAMKMNMNMEMNVIGDSAMIKKMAGAGQAFPMVMQMESGTNGDIKTSALNKDNKIPFTISMQTQPAKMTMNGKETPIPMPATNETMYGTYTADGKMNLDSVAGKKSDEMVKTMMMKTINGLQASVKFPDKPMKVGDTFTQDTPMDLPIAGMASKMNSKTTYKLTSIDKDKAYFDLVYEISMDMSGNSMGMTINMSGGGDGKLVYDMAASYPTSMHTNMNINYNMTMPQAANMKMDGKMKMLMDYTTTISAN